jgi:ribosomal protein S21
MGMMRELRARQAFEKPSIELRQQRLRAVYKQQMIQNGLI